MLFVISVGNKVLDVVPINPILAKDEEYLDALRRLLLVRHELTLLARLEEPTFYLQASSGMNEAEKHSL